MLKQRVIVTSMRRPLLMSFQHCIYVIRRGDNIKLRRYIDIGKAVADPEPQVGYRISLSLKK